MGLTRVEAVIRNPANPARAWQGRFLVDSRAIDTLVPRQHLERIGVRPGGQRVYTMADGSRVKMDVAVAQVEIMEEFTGVLVIFGDNETEPLLGVTAMESAGIEIDPVKQRLKKQSSTALKKACA
ncbi:MAG: clan AA aspartic protease [Gammaproteobacteria bacterium]|nr:clan AA aspartic protease [Gammaproteobacteria bacterium]